MVYNPNRLLMSLVAVIMLAVCSACGYGFRVRGTPLGISIDSIAIPLFESTSTDRGLEAQFTEIIRNEFISRSSINIVEKEQAGAIISGKIYEIETQPLSYNMEMRSVGGNIVTYETDGTRKLIIKVGITMTDSATGKIIWHEDSMREEAIFKVSKDPLQNRYNKEQAIKNIAGLMAKRIYLNAMERF